MTAIYAGPGTYIAVCNASDFKSHYLRIFTIPDEENLKTVEAGWYFMNRVNFVACLEMILPFSSLIGPTFFMPATKCTCGSGSVAMGRELDGPKEDDRTTLYYWMECPECERIVDAYTPEGCFAKWMGLPVPKEEVAVTEALRVKWQVEETETDSGEPIFDTPVNEDEEE